MEVDEWLRLNVKRGTKYLLAILGDEFFYNNSQNTFTVNIKPYDGITKDDANKVLELLRWKYEEEMKEKVINLNKPQVQIMGPLHLDAVIYEDGRTSLKRLGKPKK